jgi:Xaa-Pro aminopeptidase
VKSLQPRIAALRAELDRLGREAAVAFGSLHAVHVAGYDRYLSDVEVGGRPQIVPSDRLVLEEGMAMAIEPGAYFAGRVGVRVENTYAVTDGGARRIEEVAS